MFKSNQLTQAKVHNYSKPNANAKPVLCTESRGARWEPVRCPSPLLSSWWLSSARHKAWHDKGGASEQKYPRGCPRRRHLGQNQGDGLFAVLPRKRLACLLPQMPNSFMEKWKRIPSEVSSYKNPSKSSKLQFLMKTLPHCVIFSGCRGTQRESYSGRAGGSSLLREWEGGGGKAVKSERGVAWRCC